MNCQSIKKCKRSIKKIQSSSSIKITPDSEKFAFYKTTFAVPEMVLIMELHCITWKKINAIEA